MRNKKKKSNATPKGRTRSARPGKRTTLFYSLLVVLLSFAVYSSTLTHDYALDDDLITLKNTYVQEGIKGIPSIFSSGYLQGFNGEKNRVYRPMVLANMAIEVAIFGNNANVHHFFNVLFFALGCLMLYLFLTEFFGNDSRVLPLIIMIIFVLHPIHTEVVANIKSRDELLCFVFAGLSLWSLVKYLRNPHTKWLLFSLLGYFLATLSKETGLTILPVILLCIYLFSTKNRKQIIRISSWFIIVTIVHFIIRYAATEGSNEVVSDLINNSLLAANGAPEYYSTASVILGKYFVLLAFPHPLTYDYSFAQIPLYDVSDWETWVSFLAITSLIILSIYYLIKRKHVEIAFGIAFFFCTISITSNFFTAIGATMGERFLFMPSIGFAIAIGILFFKLFQVPLSADWRQIPKSALVILLVISTAFAGKTFSRNKDWKNQKTLVESGLKTSPNSARVHNHYGMYLRMEAEVSRDSNTQRALYREAIQYFDNSIAIYPDWAINYIEKGLCYLRLGQVDKSIDIYMHALELSPNNSSALNNLGLIYAQKKDFDRAVQYWQSTLDVDPNNVSALSNIGAIHFNNGDVRKSLEYYEKAIQLDPNHVNTLQNLVRAYNRLDNQEMAAYYRQKLNDMGE